MFKMSSRKQSRFFPRDMTYSEMVNEVEELEVLVQEHLLNEALEKMMKDMAEGTARRRAEKMAREMEALKKAEDNIEVEEDVLEDQEEKKSELVLQTEQGEDLTDASPGAFEDLEFQFNGPDPENVFAVYPEAEEPAKKLDPQATVFVPFWFWK